MKNVIKTKGYRNGRPLHIQTIVYMFKIYALNYCKYISSDKYSYNVHMYKKSWYEYETKPGHF